MEVQQRVRIPVDREVLAGTVTCGYGRGWARCRQMACKRSAVRARLAPPGSDTEFEHGTDERFPLEGHSEGQDPSEAGRLTSDDAELVPPRRPTALSRRSRGHQLRQGGFPGGPNSLRAAEPSSVAWCRRGSGGSRLRRGPRSHGDLGLHDRPDESPLCRDVSLKPGEVCLCVTNCREHPILPNSVR